MNEIHTTPGITDLVDFFELEFNRTHDLKKLAKRLDIAKTNFIGVNLNKSDEIALKYIELYLNYYLHCEHDDFKVVDKMMLDGHILSTNYRLKNANNKPLSKRLKKAAIYNIRKVINSNNQQLLKGFSKIFVENYVDYTDFGLSEDDYSRFLEVYEDQEFHQLTFENIEIDARLFSHKELLQISSALQETIFRIKTKTVQADYYKALFKNQTIEIGIATNYSCLAELIVTFRHAVICRMAINSVRDFNSASEEFLSMVNENSITISEVINYKQGYIKNLTRMMAENLE